jgi:hypothetical protein
MQSKYIAAIAICFICLMGLSAAGTVNAANTATHGVIIVSATPNTFPPPPDMEFPINVPMYINWAADGTVKITVTDPNGVETVLGDELPSYGYLSYTPTSRGTYFVNCTGAPASQFSAGGWFFVLPESALGTLIAVLAGFAAFGTFRLTRKHSKKRQQSS